MSKVTLSSALFEQMGGVNWQLRSDMTLHSDGSKRLERSIEPQIAEQPSEQMAMPEEEEVTTSTVIEASVMSLEKATAHSETHSELHAVAKERPSIVVLGAGLNEIWQNDSQPAWQLWQNIMLAFDWDETQVVFFDTSQLVSEEMMFTTMEEVIELGVDWVFTMDDSHELSEMLQEGVQVIAVPEIESMLMDPYAKQTFYHAAVSVTQ
ncbi:MAG: hypothetical protein L3J38_05695 [Thiomicrorhabdus sp.]|nr:hypothetical protein [Thiomicrorhabdus sp.]